MDSTVLVSIEYSAEKWAETLIECFGKNKRRDTGKEMKRARYDIDLEADKLEELYELLL